MATVTPPVTWGEALRVKTNRRLKNAVDGVRQAVGPTIGTRNTFAKLYRLDMPPADPAEAFRAWLLLTACGFEPLDWGIGDDVVPPAYDVATLRLLVTNSGWISGCVKHPKLPFLPTLEPVAA